MIENSSNILTALGIPNNLVCTKSSASGDLKTRMSVNDMPPNYIMADSNGRVWYSDEKGKAHPATHEWVDAWLTKLDIRKGGQQ